ncbi:MAG: heavy metal translocating P-type ATPase [Bacillus subtilis]|nr:heavy metal translocating P-type ATPase [Bacillus subtilis]
MPRNPDSVDFRPVSSIMKLITNTNERFVAGWIQVIRKILMKNLTCSSCIAKIERRTNRLPYVNSASFNFANQILLVDFKDDYNPDVALREIKMIVDLLEDNVETRYYETQVEVKKLNFVKEYLWVLIGMVIILVNFSLYRIPQFLNSMLGTNFLNFDSWVKDAVVLARLSLVDIQTRFQTDKRNQKLQFFQ